MRLSLLLPVLAIVLQACATPDESVSQFEAAADTFIGGAMDSIRIVPALAVAVVRGNEIVYERGFGRADIESGLTATPTTPFYIASATKSFTSLLAVLLDRDGIIDLDLSLADAFPDVTFKPEVRANEVTLRSLLSHTHGVANHPIVFRTAYTGDHDADILNTLLASTGANADAPLGSFEYTNVGYNILSLYIDRVTGKRWQDLLDERVFTPAGMTRTTAYASEPTRSGWGKAAPYGPMGPAGEDGPFRLALEKQDNTMQSAGGMFASAHDLGRWVAIQLNEGRIDGRSVFPADVIELVHRPVVSTESSYGPFARTGYGLGWYTGTYDGEAMVHHFGGFSGAHAHVSFLPDRDLGVVVLTNESVVGSRLATLVATFAYEWWLGRDDVVPRYEQQRAGLIAGSRQMIAGGKAEVARRLERQWTLGLPRREYAGTYSNPLYGTIDVAVMNQIPMARFGNMQVTATPFTAPETMRVEFIPGQGEVIGFQVSDGRVVALQYSGETFGR